MIPVFLADDAAVSVEGATDALPVRVWMYQGKAWFLAVNATYEPVKTRIKIGGKTVDLNLPALGHTLRQLD